MRPDAWKQILAAWTDIGQSIEEQLPSGRGDLAPGEESALTDLHAAIGARLAEMLSGLQALGVPNREIQQLLEPLAIAVDERVLLRLPAEIAVDWRRLEYDYHQSNDGGVLFYRRLDHLIQPGSGASELVLEVYRFCLTEGFCGALADDRPRLQQYVDRLAQAIMALVPAAEALSAPATSSPSVPSSIWQAPDRVYHWIAAAAALVVAVMIPLVTRALLR